MKRVMGYGLVLLAACMAAAPSALAWGGGGSSPAAVELSSGDQLFFLGGPGGASNRNPQGYLGVDLRDVTANQATALKLKEPRGAEIILVDHDAPAGKAGLREHDVVLQMNGQSIQGEDQIRHMLHESPPGKTIVLTISRDGQQLTVTTQMANREDVERQAWQKLIVVPEPQDATTESAPSELSTSPSASPSVRGGNSFIGSLLMNPSYTGAMLEKMSSQLADFFGVSSGAGLLVRSVVANSPAALAGMRAGDVVIRASDRPVTSTNDWFKAIKNSHGHSLAIVVLRDKKEQTLTLTPDSKRRSSLDEPSDELDPVAAHMGLSWVPGF